MNMKRKWEYQYLYEIKQMLKTIIRDNEGHYIVTEESTEEDIRIINIYAPNTGAPQYMRQILTTIKGKMDRNSIIVGDFNTPLTSMDRSSEQKINKEKQALNNTLKQLDLIDMQRGFHLKTVDFTYFSNAHRTFSRIDHTSGHKSSLGKF